MYFPDANLIDNREKKLNRANRFTSHQTFPPGFEIVGSHCLNWPITILECVMKYSNLYCDWPIQTMRTTDFEPWFPPIKSYRMVPNSCVHARTLPQIPIVPLCRKIIWSKISGIRGSPSFASFKLTNHNKCVMSYSNLYCGWTIQTMQANAFKPWSLNDLSPKRSDWQGLSTSEILPHCLSDQLFVR